MVTCPMCHGHGFIIATREYFMGEYRYSDVVDCDVCKGEGKVIHG